MLSSSAATSGSHSSPDGSPFAICRMAMILIVWGKEVTSRPLPPQRTAHDSFPLRGSSSSLSKPPCDRERHTRRIRGVMDLSVAGWVQWHPIVRCVTAAMRSPNLVMAVSSCDRGSRFVTAGATSILTSPEIEQVSKSFERGSHLESESLLRIKLPLRVGGIGLAVDLGVPLDGETMSRK
jgi:hypothetical protein